MNKNDINAAYENVSQEVKELIELGYYSIEEICGMESKPLYIQSFLHFVLLQVQFG